MKEITAIVRMKVRLQVHDHENSDEELSKELVKYEAGEYSELVCDQAVIEETEVKDLGRDDMEAGHEAQEDMRH